MSPAFPDSLTINGCGVRHVTTSPYVATPLIKMQVRLHVKKRSLYLSHLSFSFRIIPLTPSPSYLFKPENNLSFRHPLLPRQIHFSNYTHDICLQSGRPVNFHTFLRACDFLLDISLTRLRVWGQVCAFKTPFSRYPSLLSFPHNAIIKPILVRIERPRMPFAAPLCVHKRI